MHRRGFRASAPRRVRREPRRDDGERRDAVPAFRAAAGGGDLSPAHGPAAFHRRDDGDALRRPPGVGGGDARQPERPAGRADRGSRTSPPLPGEGRHRDGDVPGAAAGGPRSMGCGRAHGARVPEGVEVVRDVGIRLRRLPGPAPLREGKPDRRDRPRSVEGIAGGGPPDGARQCSGGPSPEAPGDRRDRSVAARRPARRLRGACGARRWGRIVRLLPPRPAAVGGDDGAEGGRLPGRAPGARGSGW